MLMKFKSSKNENYQSCSRPKWDRRILVKYMNAKFRYWKFDFTGSPQYLENLEILEKTVFFKISPGKLRKLYTF